MSGKKYHPDRRQLLKGIGLGVCSLSMGHLASVQGSSSPEPLVRKRGRLLFQKITHPVNVSMVKGNDRREITLQALKNIENEIIPAIADKRILIKPNFVTTNRQLSATHVDAVRAILDFLRPHYHKQIIIGESTANRRSTTMEGYKNYGYLPLEKEYNVKLVDLNTFPYVYRFVFGKGSRPTPVRIIKAFLDKDLFIISAAKLKTHDRVVTTLSLKNVLMASPLNDYHKNDKWLMHTERNFSKEAVLHFNLFQLAQEIYPDLGVIDGFVGMEGNGPVGGDPVDTRLALASMDPLALDVLATKVMGFDPTQILYLNSFNEAGMGQGDLDKIKILGSPLEQCQYHFKGSPHLIKAYHLTS